MALGRATEKVIPYPEETDHRISSVSIFDVKEPIVMATDASSTGMGAAIIQNEHPCAYASRSMSETEKNYAPIEKEMLAILNGCTRFHDYIFGQRVTVETDHKPLVGIFNKPLNKLSPRIQKMRMKLLRYDLKLVWKPGKEMFVPDTLSRAYLKDPVKPLFNERVEICSVISVMPISNEKLQVFREATEKDPVLQVLRKQLLVGWPEHRREVPECIRPYYMHKDDITCCDQLMFRGNQVIIPSELRSDMLKRIHESHQGVVKSKQRARDVMFWPGMNAEIEDVVDQCAKCQSMRKAEPAEPMISHKLPERPWSKVGSDLFKHNGRDYVLCVDYYSKFPEMSRLCDQSSYTVVQSLKSMFARHGIPEEVVSDGGPQYSGSEFQKFSQEWEFKHTMSSPAYPQSNGQAEATVK